MGLILGGEIRGVGKIPWNRKIPGTGKYNLPVFLSGKFYLDSGAWRATVREVAGSDRTEESEALLESWGYVYGPLVVNIFHCWRWGGF